MKLLTTLLAMTAITFECAAAPTLVIDAVISKNAKEVYREPALFVENGGCAVMHAEKLDYSMTPILGERDTVVVHVVITLTTDGKTKTIAEPRIAMQLGKEAKIQINDVALSIKVSPAK